MPTATSSPKRLKNASPFRQTLFIVGLGLAVLVFFILDIALGSVDIPLPAVFQILFNQDQSEPAWVNIIYKIRLPKAITALLAGAGLSVGGLQMQTLFRNPLAGPSVLGVTAGASLGVAAVMLTGSGVTTLYTIRQLGVAGGWLLMVVASAGAALVLIIILLVSLRVRDNVILLIVGIMLGNITLSLVSIWQYFSQPEQIKDYLLWTFGSLGGVTTTHLFAMLPAVAFGLVLAFFSSKWLNGMLLGENYARSLGLPVYKAQVLIITTTSLLAGSITGFCGPIGFIGIAVPHLVRSLLNTAEHRLLVPGCCLMGAFIMLVCDLISQWPGSTLTLPINAITALIGSPVVIWVILSRNNLKASFG